MFDLGWGKIVIIAVIALVVIGPKELPAVLRTVGQWMGKIRRMAAEFQGQFQEAMREAEMADLKKSIDAITDATRGIGSGFDPLSSVTKNIESAFQEKPSETPSTAAATTEPAGTPAPTTEPSVAAEPPLTIEPPVPTEPAPAPPVAEAAAPAEAVTPAPTPPPANDAGGRAA
jgi:sec-independent protein translocase protein TatB